MKKFFLELPFVEFEKLLVAACDFYDKEQAEAVDDPDCYDEEREFIGTPFSVINDLVYWSMGEIDPENLISTHYISNLISNGKIVPNYRSLIENLFPINVKAPQYKTTRALIQFVQFILSENKIKDEEPIKSAAATLGSIKSDRKAASSRNNGRLGGRPKKEKEA